MTSSFDKNNLGEESFALGKKIHRDKRKGVSGLSQRAYLEKSSKRYIVCMRAYDCPIVKGNSFGIFRIPGTII